MDTKAIPSVFWYSLSFCMITATIGILFIFYLAGSVSIEVASAKINMTKAVYKVREVRADLEKKSYELAEKEKALMKIKNSHQPESTMQLFPSKPDVHFNTGINGFYDKFNAEKTGDADFKEIDKKLGAIEDFLKD